MEWGRRKGVGIWRRVKEVLMRRRGKEYKEPGARGGRRKEEKQTYACGGGRCCKQNFNVWRVFLTLYKYLILKIIFFFIYNSQNNHNLFIILKDFFSSYFYIFPISIKQS